MEPEKRSVFLTPSVYEGIGKGNVRVRSVGQKIHAHARLCTCWDVPTKSNSKPICVPQSPASHMEKSAQGLLLAHTSLAGCAVRRRRIRISQNPDLEEGVAWLSGLHWADPKWRLSQAFPFKPTEKERGSLRREKASPQMRETPSEVCCMLRDGLCRVLRFPKKTAHTKKKKKEKMIPFNSNQTRHPTHTHTQTNKQTNKQTKNATCSKA